VDVSLGALRQRLLNFRSWDSTGETLDNRIREVLNTALDRLAGDVPEALIPDEEHIALIADVNSADTGVVAYVNPWAVSRWTGGGTAYTDADARLLMFEDSANKHIADAASATSWRPVDTGEWNGKMHIEVTDASTGQVFRRQCLEFFSDTVIQDEDAGTTHTYWGVSLDRPISDLSTINTGAANTFRLYQPEFFLRDDVMEVLEPARVYDSSRQQVWSMATGDAHRQDMLDFQGNSKGRPSRMWRGRHFQLPAPTEPPEITQLNLSNEILSSAEADTTYKSDLFWGYKKAEATLPPGTWGLCYTYVMGSKDKEWQQSPAISARSFSSALDVSSQTKVTWAHGSKPFSTDTEVAPPGAVHLTAELNTEFGTYDPLWESAPSPIATFKQLLPDDVSSQGKEGTKNLPAMVFAATNIDAMLGFDDEAGLRGVAMPTGVSVRGRFGRSAYRIRYYLAYLSKNETKSTHGDFNSMEYTPRYYYLCEAEPTYDMINDAGGATSVTPDKGIYTPYEPPDVGSSFYSGMTKKGGRVVWHGTELPDYQRPLRHSTGYYAYKSYPHQDARYELDFRVLRLPRKYIDDQDTAPIQRDAVPALIELALHYLCLVDGVDQQGSQVHLDRYTELARKYRERYANSGKVVEPVSILGYSTQRRYGKFGNDT
jgi:hypothetical protein